MTKAKKAPFEPLNIHSSSAIVNEAQFHDGSSAVQKKTQMDEIKSFL